jgi:hypothetical protein
MRFAFLLPLAVTDYFRETWTLLAFLPELARGEIPAPAYWNQAASTQVSLVLAALFLVFLEHLRRAVALAHRRVTQQ